MAEYSYPVLEEPMTMDKWRSVTLGIGSGVFDEGGGPYAIALSNATDSATIRVDRVLGYAHAIVSGFYHKMDSPTTVSLPPVTSTTTYTIALCYDPLSTANPVSLKVVTGALDKTAGKEWLVLHTVTREPNRLLTESVVQTVKPSIAPLINVRNFRDLPDPDDTLAATTAFVSAEEAIYRVSGVGGAAQWHKISGEYFENAASLSGWSYRTSFPKEIAVSPAHGSLHCRFSGQIIHQNRDTPIGGTKWVTVGTMIPNALRSNSEMDLHIPAVYFHGSTGVTNVVLQLNLQTGVLSLLPPPNGMTVKTGGGITFDASWAVTRNVVGW